jgi:hypothetical protein
MAETPGPEKYAPQAWRPSNTNQATADTTAIQNLYELVRPVAAGPLDEIDRLTRELTSERDMNLAEGERASREIASYASLSDAATTLMKVTASSIKQWNEAPIRPGTPLR